MLTFEDSSDLIIQRICENGYKAYLCGGAVRDHFLNKESSDYDIVTSATPNELKQIFPDRKVNLVGANFLVTLIDNIEVATYRSDKNFLNGRQNCISTVCKTLEEDLERRDFTINSMAICPYVGDVIDPFNGLQDLKNRIIRFVGDPEKRIKEDYLRMIRAARFTCLIEGTIEENSFQAIQINKNLVKEIAPERIRLELLKVMKYKKPSIFFNILHSTGILKIILPELDYTYGHTGGKYHGETVDQHSMLTGDYLSPKRPILRLTGYLHDIGKPDTYDGENFIDHENVGADYVENILKRYKFTNCEIEKASCLTLYHMRSFSNDVGNKAIRRLVKTFTDNNINWKEWLLLKIADKRSNLSKVRYDKEKIKDIILKIHNSKKLTISGGFKITDLKVDGNDVMKILNIKPGKEVGLILKKLLDMVIDEPELNNKDLLKTEIRRIKL